VRAAAARIQLLRGHVSIETTERYLDRESRFQNAVNDVIGLIQAAREPERHQRTSGFRVVIRLSHFASIGIQFGATRFGALNREARQAGARRI